MQQINTFRGKLFIYVCVLLLPSVACHARGSDGSGPIRLRELPPVIHHVAAFPRLVAGASHAIVKRINQVLARSDASARAAAKACFREAAAGRANWERQVSVTMRGPHFVSFVASDDYYCGGAYPDTSTMALVFDVSTGALVDWAKLLPVVAQRTQAEVRGKDGATVTFSSAKLADFYKEAAKRDAGEPDCVDVLSQTELEFILWPDAKQGGLVVQPHDLPHVVAACGPALPMSLETLRSFGADAELLDAIDAAHRKSRGG